MRPPQSLLVLGGTSRIALATARRMIARRTRTVWLAGRPSPALESAASELRALGAVVHTVAFDALDPDSHETVLGKVFAEGAIDMVLLAFGVLGDQAQDEREPAAAVRVARTNYIGAVSSGLISARALQSQGHGSLVVLSSVMRRTGPPRELHLRLQQGRPGHLRPGAGRRAARHGRARHGRTAGARTVEDHGRPEGGLAHDHPESVAAAIELGLRRGSETVWVPGTLRVLTSALRHLPRTLFRRLAV